MDRDVRGNCVEDADGRTARPAGRALRPSGSGKSTLVRRLLARPGLRLTVSVSATTRPPRPGEGPGRDYFLSAPGSSRKLAASCSSRPRSTAILRHAGRAGRRPLAAGNLRHPGDRRPGGLPGPPEGPRRPARVRPGPRPGRPRGPPAGPRHRRRATIERRWPPPAASWSSQVAYDVHVVNDDLDRAVGATRRDPDSERLWSEQTMIDELKEEEIVNKVGGRFKLSTLIQKRMIALNQGARRWWTCGGRQDDDRDPGDHAGEDLPGHVGQAPDGRADRGAGDRRRNRRSYPAGRMSKAARPIPGMKSGLRAARAWSRRRPKSRRQRRRSGSPPGVSRPGLAPGRSRSRLRTGGFHARSTALARSAPALIFVSLILFLALSLDGYDPADAPGSGAEPANHRPRATRAARSGRRWPMSVHHAWAGRPGCSAGAWRRSTCWSRPPNVPDRLGPAIGFALVLVVVGRAAPQASPPASGRARRSAAADTSAPWRPLFSPAISAPTGCSSSSARPGSSAWPSATTCSSPGRCRSSRLAATAPSQARCRQAQPACRPRRAWPFRPCPSPGRHGPVAEPMRPMPPWPDHPSSLHGRPSDPRLLGSPPPRPAARAAGLALHARSAPADPGSPFELPPLELLEPPPPSRSRSTRPRSTPAPCCWSGPCSTSATRSASSRSTPARSSPSSRSSSRPACASRGS